MDQKKKSQRMLILVLCVLAVVVVFFFAGRMAFHLFHSPRPLPRQTNVQLIQGWMTLPYISRTYGVPMKDLHVGLMIKPSANDKESIDDLAKSLNVESDIFIVELQKVITTFQESHVTPPKPI